MFSDYLAFLAIAVLCVSVAMPFIVIAVAQQYDKMKPPPAGSLSIAEHTPDDEHM